MNEEIKIVARIVGVTRKFVQIDLLVEDLEVGFAPNVKPGPWFGEKAIVTITRSGEANMAPLITKIEKYAPKAPPPAEGK